MRQILCLKLHINSLDKVSTWMEPGQDIWSLGMGCGKSLEQVITRDTVSPHRNDVGHRTTQYALERLILT